MARPYDDSDDEFLDPATRVQREREMYLEDRAEAARQEREEGPGDFHDDSDWHYPRDSPDER